jgi:hypothetical protein
MELYLRYAWSDPKILADQPDWLDDLMADQPGGLRRSIGLALVRLGGLVAGQAVAAPIASGI